MNRISLKSPLGQLGPSMQLRLISVYETRKRQQLLESRKYKKPEVSHQQLDEEQHEIRRQLIQLRNNQINGVVFDKVKKYMSYNDTIHYCRLVLNSNTRDLSKIEQIVCDLDVPSLNLINLLLDRYLRVHDGKSMERLLRYMIQQNLDINHCVMCLLKHYAKDGPVASAVKLMEFAKPRIKLEKEHYALLIDAYSASGRPWEVMSVLGDVEALDLKLDLTLLQRALSAFAKNGEIQGMMNILKIIVDKKFPMNTFLYNILITGYKKAGNTQRGSKS